MKQQLREKLDAEYEAYMEQAGQMPAESIMQNLEAIGAMLDVYTFISERVDELDDDELTIMLSDETPLLSLRDQWLYNDKDISESMNQAIWNYCEPYELDEDETGDHEQGD